MAVNKKTIERCVAAMNRLYEIFDRKYKDEEPELSDLEVVAYGWGPNRVNIHLARDGREWGISVAVLPERNQDPSSIIYETMLLRKYEPTNHVELGYPDVRTFESEAAVVAEVKRVLGY
jgi:hypothetical protein